MQVVLRCVVSFLLGTGYVSCRIAVEHRKPKRTLAQMMVTMMTMTNMTMMMLLLLRLLLTRRMTTDEGDAATTVSFQTVQSPVVPVFVSFRCGDSTRYQRGVGHGRPAAPTITTTRNQPLRAVIIITTTTTSHSEQSCWILFCNNNVRIQKRLERSLSRRWWRGNPHPPRPHYYHHRYYHHRYHHPMDAISPVHTCCPICRMNLIFPW